MFGTWPIEGCGKVLYFFLHYPLKTKPGGLKKLKC